MDREPDTPPTGERSRSGSLQGTTWLPARVALFYLLFATAWILFSDDVVEWLIQNRSQAAAWHTYKGLAFVVVTSAVLFSVLRRRMAVIERASQARLKAEQELARFAAELERRVHERTAELENKNRELARYSHTVSHDLKAPLMRIGGFSSLLQEEHAQALNDEGRRFVDTIRRSAHELSLLIDDLLAYAEAEQREVRRTQIAMTPLIQGVLSEFQSDLKARNADVTLSIEIAEAVADADGLRTALRNLVGNAIKFTPADRSPRIEIGTRCEGRNCILWVRDEGIGFDMRDHDRMFEIFERLHRAPEYPGTGVGLSIVAKAMERMGGRAYAKSKAGTGSTFILEFPLLRGS